MKKSLTANSSNQLSFEFNSLNKRSKEVKVISLNSYKSSERIKHVERILKSLRD